MAVYEMLDDMDRWLPLAREKLGAVADERLDQMEQGSVYFCEHTIAIYKL